jgi:predicted branched-subunit amino acid permease
MGSLRYGKARARPELVGRGRVRRADLLGGVVATLPLLPGILAWGVAFGAAAAAVGLRPPDAVTMSALAWSGTAQAAALSLLRGPLAAIFLSSVLVSLRFVPMGLALAGLLPSTGRWRRVLLACCLADATFAIVAAGRVRTPAGIAGTWLAQYPVWVAGTALGALGAPLLPARLLAASEGLVAVIFAVLVVEVCTDRRQAAVAALAAVLAAAGLLALPGTLALPVAALLASTAGVVVRR